MRTVPINRLLLDTAIAINGKVVLAGMRKVAVVIDAKVQRAGALRGSPGVRDRQAHRDDAVLDDIEALEGSRDGGLGGEGDAAGVGGGVEDGDFVGGGVAVDVEVFWQVSEVSLRLY